MTSYLLSYTPIPFWKGVYSIESDCNNVQASLDHLCLCRSCSRFCIWFSEVVSLLQFSLCIGNCICGICFVIYFGASGRVCFVIVAFPRHYHLYFCISWANENAYKPQMLLLCYMILCISHTCMIEDTFSLYVLFFFFFRRNYSRFNISEYLFLTLSSLSFWHRLFHLWIWT